MCIPRRFYRIAGGSNDGFQFVDDRVFQRHQLGTDFFACQNPCNFPVGKTNIFAEQVTDTACGQTLGCTRKDGRIGVQSNGRTGRIRDLRSANGHGGNTGHKSVNAGGCRVRVKRNVVFTRGIPYDIVKRSRTARDIKFRRLGKCCQHLLQISTDKLGCVCITGQNDQRQSKRICKGFSRNRRGVCIGHDDTVYKTAAADIIGQMLVGICTDINGIGNQRMCLAAAARAGKAGQLF